MPEDFSGGEISTPRRSLLLRAYSSHTRIPTYTEAYAMVFSQIGLFLDTHGNIISRENLQRDFYYWGHLKLANQITV